MTIRQLTPKICLNVLFVENQSSVRRRAEHIFLYVFRNPHLLHVVTCAILKRIKRLLRVGLCEATEGSLYEIRAVDGQERPAPFNSADVDEECCACAGAVV